jgi:hypothetical protein
MGCGHASVPLSTAMAQDSHALLAHLIPTAVRVRRPPCMSPMHPSATLKPAAVLPVPLWDIQRRRGREAAAALACMQAAAQSCFVHEALPVCASISCAVRAVRVPAGGAAGAGGSVWSLLGGSEGQQRAAAHALAELREIAQQRDEKRCARAVTTASAASSNIVPASAAIVGGPLSQSLTIAVPHEEAIAVEVMLFTVRRSPLAITGTRTDSSGRLVSCKLRTVLPGATLALLQAPVPLAAAATRAGARPAGARAPQRSVQRRRGGVESVRGAVRPSGGTGAGLLAAECDSDDDCGDARGLEAVQRLAASSPGAAAEAAGALTAAVVAGGAECVLLALWQLVGLVATGGAALLTHVARWRESTWRASASAAAVLCVRLQRRCSEALRLLPVLLHALRTLELALPSGSEGGRRGALPRRPPLHPATAADTGTRAPGVALRPVHVPAGLLGPPPQHCLLRERACTTLPGLTLAAGSPGMHAAADVHSADAHAALLPPATCSRDTAWQRIHRVLGVDLDRL